MIGPLTWGVPIAMIMMNLMGFRNRHLHLAENVQVNVEDKRRQDAGVIMRVMDSGIAVVVQVQPVLTVQHLISAIK